jgi:polyhydroxyalkanoate synthase
MMQGMIEAMQQTVPAPRPLALHLAVQNLMFASSWSALPGLKDGSLVWKDSLNPQARSLRKKLQHVESEAFADALDNEIQGRVRAFAEGINRFAAVERAPSMPALPEEWREGTTRLLHAGADGGGATPVVLIPSLVNRAYILDLDPAHSLVRTLAARGHDTYLLDWDAPGPAEASFSIDHYVDRLERVRDHVRERTGHAPVIAGYCMGGNLALALAHRAPEKIRAMALLATPWDFHAMPPSATQMLAAMMPAFRQLIATLGSLPVDVIQAMFSSRDPAGVIAKFRQFAAMKPGSKRAQAFVHLEDWLNDGVALSGPVALECLQDWYVDNRPMAGTWQSGGRPLDVTALDVDALVVIPDHDTIVPPSSARPLAEQLPRATLVTANAGHIGMVAGSKAKKTLYTPLGDWIAALQ